MQQLHDPVTGETVTLYATKGEDVYRVHVDAVIRNLAAYYRVDETEARRMLEVMTKFSGWNKMSLTRNEWIEMWGDIKLLELNTSRLNEFYKTLGPYDRKKLRDMRRENRVSIAKVKHRIQSVIGQMEWTQ